MNLNFRFKEPFSPFEIYVEGCGILGPASSITFEKALFDVAAAVTRIDSILNL